MFLYIFLWRITRTALSFCACNLWRTTCWEPLHFGINCSQIIFSVWMSFAVLFLKPVFYQYAETSKIWALRNNRKSSRWFCASRQMNEDTFNDEKVQSLKMFRFKMMETLGSFVNDVTLWDIRAENYRGESKRTHVGCLTCCLPSWAARKWLN